MTDIEVVDLYVIARLTGVAAVADIYSCALFYDTADGHPTGRAVQDWWGAEVCEPGEAATIDDLDATLSDLGYRRTSEWRERVSASGALRYFANAEIRCEATR
jgi:hypothetical protein